MILSLGFIWFGFYMVWVWVWQTRQTYEKRFCFFVGLVHIFWFGLCPARRPGLLPFSKLHATTHTHTHHAPLLAAALYCFNMDYSVYGLVVLMHIMRSRRPLFICIFMDIMVVLCPARRPLFMCILRLF